MRWLLLLALLGASGASEARMHHPYRGHRIVPVASAPLDGFTTPSGAYSFRKLKSTYSGSAIRIRRASDNAELDIGFLGFTSFTGAPWDEAAAVAHCAATSCFVKTMYDQSGNARDVVNATAANQPALNFSCNGPNKPCAELLDSTDLMSGSATPGPATGVVSIGGVFRRTTGVGLCSVLRQNGLASSNRIQTANGIANTWTLAGGTSGTINATAADAAWHTTAGVINGASSSLTITARQQRAVLLEIRLPACWW